MWIRTTTSRDSVHLADPVSYSYIAGPDVLEYYFDNETACILEQIGFLSEFWKKFDSTLDWGDCEFFSPDKCILLKDWLQHQITENIPDPARSVYTILLAYSETAVKFNTGISFDF